MLSLGLLAVAFLPTAGCGGPYATPRYRISLTLMVDGERITAGNVYEAKFGRSAFPSNLAYELRLRGEAIAIDLGPRGLLISLMTGRRPDGHQYGDLFDGLPKNVFERAGLLPNDQKAQDDRTLIWRAMEQPGLKAELRLSDIPYLMYFSDPSNPDTRRAVDSSNPSRTLGPGVVIVGGTIETTRAPVTSGIIQRKLPWLAEKREAVRWKGVSTASNPERGFDPSDYIQD